MSSHPPSRPERLRRACHLLVVAGCAVVSVLASVSAAGAVAPPPAGTRSGVHYAPPVDAPVADAFRPPPHPFGAGNRGLEYDTAPGDAVVASAAGDVVFAGPVGGALHVTLRHDDGLRTSYSFLAGVEVGRGVRVERGDRLGTAGERLHFGVRAGDAYLDPASLFDATATVVLLPLEVPPGTTPGAEARALVGLTSGRRRTADDLAAAVDWLRDRGDDLGAAVHGGLMPAAGLLDRVLVTEPCSAGPPPRRPAATAAGRRVAVTVGGLGSSSAGASIDDLPAARLGYDGGDVVRFSYAGGRTPGTGSALAGIERVDERPYASADTQGDVRLAAGRLADLVEQVAAGEPDVTIDVYAHSLGGVVARLALDELQRRGVDLGRVGLVATLATPHDGADLASVVSTTADRPVSGVALDGLAGALDLDLDPDAAVVAQLAPRSDVIDELAATGIPAGVDVLSIGARGDLVVPSLRTRLDGATHVVVPVGGLHAHSDVVGSGETSAEIARALTGRPPGCEPWHDVLADVLAGHATAAAEGHLALLARRAP
jgi:hypothetical protein